MNIMELVKDVAAVIGLILSAIALLTWIFKPIRHFWAKLFHASSKELREENAKQTADIQKILKNQEQTLNRVDSLELTIDKMGVQMSNVEGVSRQQCRDTIKSIYYKYCKTEELPLYEKKTLIKTWEAYQKFPEANSYAKLLMDIMDGWKVIPGPEHEAIDD